MDLRTKWLTFVRSLLPAQWTQLLLLLGILCLYVAAFVAWAPMPNADALAALGGPQREPWIEPPEIWLRFLFIPRFLILIAAVASLAVCFRRGEEPVRRLRRWVLLPVLAGLALVWLRVLIVAGAPKSILVAPSDTLSRLLAQIPRFIVDLGPGLHFAVAGLVLLGVVASRINRGLVSLPVRFGSPAGEVFGKRATEQTSREIFKFTQLVIASELFSSLLYSFYLLTLAGTIAFVSRAALHIIVLLGLSAVPSLWALVLLGKERRDELGWLFRGAAARDYGLALLVPVLAVGVPQLLFYGLDHVAWVAQHPDLPYIPIGSHIQFPSPWLLLMFPLALFEEIGWRGYLQPGMVSQFGLRRGILLVGLVWGLFHFAGDLNQKSGDVAVLVAGGVRLLSCVVYSVPLGWLMLRARSILPVAVMHGAFNIVLQYRRGIWLALPYDYFGSWAELGMWAFLGYLLFKRWPPQPQPS